VRHPIRVWRLVKERYAATAFDGEGAKQVGGRWNSPGVAVVYTSESISLAVLETLVHTDVDDLVAIRYVAIPVDIPAAVQIRRIAESTLPQDWQRYDSFREELRKIGDDWVRQAREAVLAVPSIVVPQEANYILNPAHKDMKKLVIGKPLPFTPDKRLKAAKP
jgi:RES domain-containing protein